MKLFRNGFGIWKGIPFKSSRIRLMHKRKSIIQETNDPPFDTAEQNTQRSLSFSSSPSKTGEQHAGRKKSGVGLTCQVLLWWWRRQRWRQRRAFPPSPITPYLCQRNLQQDLHINDLIIQYLSLSLSFIRESTQHPKYVKYLQAVTQRRNRTIHAVFITTR